MPRKLTVTAALIVGLAICILVALARPASPTSADPQLDSEEQAFVTLINNYRAQNGLGPLSIDWEMQASSDWMSADMGQKGYFSHTDSMGRDPWTRMCDFGYCYNTWKGENIAAGYTTAQSVFTAWQNSPGHNANMLGANYTAMGISRVNTPGSVYGWYWTNDFGGVNSNATPPASATPATSPTLTPSPTASPTNSPSPTPSPTHTPSPSPTHTATPSPTHTPTATPTSTPTPSPTASPTRSPAPSPTPSVCPAVSGAGHPVLIGPLIISAPGFYNGDGQTVIGGDNNIDIEASNVTVCNYTLRERRERQSTSDAFNHITLSALNIQDYNQSGAGGVVPGGPQYVGGVACWYCTGLTVVDSTIASTKDYGNGIWVKRTNAAEAGPDYFARNTIIGGWDGIGSEPEGDPDGGFGSGTIIENNFVSGCHDDGIQVEGRDENITVRNNTITGCGTGVATAAALVGPVHIENNYIHDLVLAPSTAFFCFKLGASQGTNTPEIDYTGNTCIAPGAGGFEQTNSGLNFKIVATHNCIQDGLYVIDFNELPGPWNALRLQRPVHKRRHRPLRQVGWRALRPRRVARPRPGATRRRGPGLPGRNPDGSSDVFTYAYFVANAHVHCVANPHAHCVANPHAYCVANPHAHCVANPHAHCVANPHAHCVANPHANFVTDPHDNLVANAFIRSHAYSHTDTDCDCIAHAITFVIFNAHANAGTDPPTTSGADKHAYASPPTGRPQRRRRPERLLRPPRPLLRSRSRPSTVTPIATGKSTPKTSYVFWRTSGRWGAWGQAGASLISTSTAMGESMPWTRWRYYSLSRSTMWSCPTVACPSEFEIAGPVPTDRT